MSSARAATEAAAGLHAALDVVQRQLALGHPGYESEGARFVRDPRHPRIYDANSHSRATSGRNRS